jgi:5'-3' exonuclease
MTLPSVSAASVASQPPARQDARRPTILLIDGSHALFRAFFAIRNLTSPSGQPTGAVFGFTSMLLKLLRERKPERVGVCFDTSEATFRHDLDANYKANRPDMPPDLSLQWPIAQRISEELGLPILRKPGLEADDLIATLATQAHKQGWDVLIVSGDKDLMQLVRDAQGDRGAILQLDDGKGVVYDPRGVTEKWGVPPERVGDLLAIMGDSVDNVPGVRGIGEKGAVKLLQQWGTLDAIYANIEAVEPPRTRQLLIDSSASARLSRQLVELHCDADLPWKPEDLEPRGANRPALATSFAELGFKTLLKVYTDEPETQAAQIETRAVTDLAALETVVAQIRVAGRVALTAVTTECDPERVRPMSGDLVGLGLCWLPGHAVYVPVGHTQSGTVQLPWADVQRVLGPVLEDAGIAKVGHAGKYETLVLRRHGVEVRGWKADSQLASYLYEPERYTHTLRNVAFNRLQVTLPGDEELLGKGKAQIGWDAVPCEKATAHVAMRAALTLAATDALQPLLDETNVRGLYDGLELPLQDVLADMEFAGIRVDAAELGRQGEWLAQEIAKEEAEIHELAGEAFHADRLVDGFLGARRAGGPPPDCAEGVALAAVVQAEVDVHGHAAHADRQAHGAGAHVLSAGGGGDGAAVLDRAEPAEHPDPDPGRSADSHGVHRGPGLRTDERGLQPDRAAGHGAPGARSGLRGGVPARLGHPSGNRGVGVPGAGGSGDRRDALECQGDRVRHPVRHGVTAAGARDRRVAQGSQGVHRAVFPALSRGQGVRGADPGGRAPDRRGADPVRAAAAGAGPIERECDGTRGGGTGGGQHAGAGDGGGPDQAGDDRGPPATARGWVQGPAFAAGP